jgi:hypothetical protein
MILSNDAYVIGRLYELITESPDNIRVNGRVYAYDDPSLGNITGLFSDNGNFVMSKDVRGHYELGSLITKRRLHTVNAISNFNDIEHIYQDPTFTQYTSKHEFRIWPKFEIFSMYGYYVPEYKKVILEVVSKVGQPEAYLYDAKTASYNHGDSTMFKTYDEFFVDDLGDSEDKAAQEYAERAKNERAMGNYMAGLNNKKQMEYYPRGGD